MIIALRNKKGSYNNQSHKSKFGKIIALRNKKGSYNTNTDWGLPYLIIALRNEKRVLLQYSINLLFNNNVFNFILFLHFFLMLSLPFFI